MNASKAIAAESTVALAGAVIGDLIQQGPGRTLPRPKQIMAIFVFYGILSLVAGFGRGPARFAAAAGGVAALTLLVIGGAGATLSDFLQRITKLIESPSSAAAAAPPPNISGFGGSFTGGVNPRTGARTRGGGGGGGGGAS